MERGERITSNITRAWCIAHIDRPFADPIAAEPEAVCAHADSLHPRAS